MAVVTTVHVWWWEAGEESRGKQRKGSKMWLWPASLCDGQEGTSAARDSTSKTEKLEFAENSLHRIYAFWRVKKQSVKV